MQIVKLATILDLVNSKTADSNQTKRG